MTALRRTVGKGMLIAAFVLPPLLCAAPLVAPSLLQRPRYIAFYIAPFALIFLLWVRCRLLASWAAVDARLAVDVLAVGLSALRLAGPVVPPSGHMLFFVFSLLTTSAVGYRMLALALIAEASYIKLVIWQDRTSWALGVLAGSVLGVAYFAPTILRMIRGGSSQIVGTPDA